MAIQHRRGAKADFNAQKMLAGEIAVTTDGTRKAYVAFAPGDVKELASKEDVQNIVDNFTNSVDKKISEAVEQVTTEAEEQIAAVIQKGEEVLDSIPADYQEIAESVAQHETEIATLTQSKSDAITVEKSGTSIVATDSSDKGFEQFRTYGGSTQETTSGKNLFKNTITSQTINDLKFTVNDDGTVIVNGTASKDAFAEVETDVLPKGSYIFSCTPSGGNTSTYYSALRTADMSSVIGREIGKGLNFELSEDSSIIVVLGAKNGTTVNNLTFKPMIRKADITDSTYEPYTGGQASPNPEYPQPIVSAGQMLVDGVVTDVGISKKITGAQLFNNDTITFASNASSATDLIRSDYGIKFTTNSLGENIGVFSSERYTGVYTISLDIALSDLNFNFIKIGNSTVLKSSGYTAGKVVHVETSLTFKGSRIQFYVNNHDKAVGTVVTISNIMLNAGTEALPWEPYTEQTLTLNHVLRGIPVTDASLANYTDANGQMWCADYGDVERKVWVQCDNGFIVDGINENNIYSTSDGIKWWCSVSVRDSALYHKSFSAHTNVMCDKFTIVHTQREDDEATGTCMSAYGHANYLEFRFRFLQSDYPTKEDVINAVKGTIVYYPLATPIETPLTDEEIAAYDALHTNKPTTVITNDAGCFMEVEYVADTKTHIAQNYVPVTAFNNVLDRISALERLHV